MTRDEWLTGFTERIRHVLQTHAREREIARTGRLISAELSTDAAIDELGRFVLDAVEDIPSKSVAA